MSETVTPEQLIDSLTGVDIQYPIPDPFEPTIDNCLRGIRAAIRALCGHRITFERSLFRRIRNDAAIRATVDGYDEGDEILEDELRNIFLELCIVLRGSMPGHFCDPVYQRESELRLSAYTLVSGSNLPHADTA